VNVLRKSGSDNFDQTGGSRNNCSSWLRIQWSGNCPSF
jgi:hypothetical protein